MLHVRGKRPHVDNPTNHEEGIMGRLDGKVALISGGARGQGETEAKLFAREGAQVVFGDVLDEEGKRVEEAIRAAGGEAMYVHLNVTQEADWQCAVQTAMSTYAKLDILVNNAGIVRRVTIEETSRETWDEVTAVNATGVFLGTKYALPAMRRAGGGSIINISSISGMVAIGAPAYNASKGAVRVFTKVTAIEQAKNQIRCNSIHPGPIDTPMLRSGITDPHQLARRVREVPLGRLGTTEDIAYGALYLASDESSLVTGAELVIDGGYTAQ
jgi:NAD(P)-dependent dehydrogenase (short-subunit alcohol dehydrogenase family)